VQSLLAQEWAEDMAEPMASAANWWTMSASCLVWRLENTFRSVIISLTAEVMDEKSSCLARLTNLVLMFVLTVDIL